MRFAFQTVPTNRPVDSAEGIRVRHVPIMSVRLLGPLGLFDWDGRVDSGADDTIFPEWIAQRIGVDLTKAPWGESGSVGGSPIRYRYATVTLYLTDQVESCEWKAIVGFVNLPNMRWGLPGNAGCQQFFDMALFGSRREIELRPNTASTGRHWTP